MAAEEFEHFEPYLEDGTVECPLCGHPHEPTALQSHIDDYRLTDREFADLCETAREGKLGLVLRVGLHVTDAIEDIGEPTIELQENFDRLETYLEDIEATAEELEAQAEEWRTERDRLQEVKNDIDELEKEQLPDTVQTQLESLGDKVEGQLTQVDEKLAELTTGSYHSGTQQEFELATRARNLNLGDEVVPKGGRNEEDLTIHIHEDGDAVGTIVIESKNVKNHRSKHIEQLERYKTERDAEVGLLVTTDMPSRARHTDVDYWDIGNGMLVLRPDVFEVAYLLARYAILAMHATEVEYDEKRRALEGDQDEAQALLNRIIEEVNREEVISDVEAIINHVEEQNEDIEQIRDYNERRLNKLRERNREEILTRLERILRDIQGLDTILSDTE